MTSQFEVLQSDSNRVLVIVEAEDLDAALRKSRILFGEDLKVRPAMQTTLLSFHVLRDGRRLDTIHAETHQLARQMANSHWGADVMLEPCVVDAPSATITHPLDSRQWVTLDTLQKWLGTVREVPGSTPIPSIEHLLDFIQAGGGDPVGVTSHGVQMPGPEAAPLDRVTVGTPVVVHDRYRFAIPVEGNVHSLATTNDGVEVCLSTSSNPGYPVGTTVWVSEKQIERKSAGKPTTTEDPGESADHVELPTGAKRSNAYPPGHKFPARYDLLFRNATALRRLAETWGEGEAKYGPDNCWKGFPESVDVSHALEHIRLYLAGDQADDHLSHAVWNLMHLMWVQDNKPGLLDLTKIPQKI